MSTSIRWRAHHATVYTERDHDAVYITRQLAIRDDAAMLMPANLYKGIIKLSKLHIGILLTPYRSIHTP